MAVFDVVPHDEPLCRIAKLLRACAPDFHLGGDLSEMEVGDRKNALNECSVGQEYALNECSMGVKRREKMY